MTAQYLFVEKVGVNFRSIKDIGNFTIIFPGGLERWISEKIIGLVSGKIKWTDFPDKLRPIIIEFVVKNKILAQNSIPREFQRIFIDFLTAFTEDFLDEIEKKPGFYMEEMQNILTEDETLELLLATLLGPYSEDIYSSLVENQRDNFTVRAPFLFHSSIVEKNYNIIVNTVLSFFLDDAQRFSDIEHFPVLTPEYLVKF